MRMVQAKREVQVCCRKGVDGEHDFVLYRSLSVMYALEGLCVVRLDRCSRYCKRCRVALLREGGARARAAAALAGGRGRWRCQNHAVRMSRTIALEAAISSNPFELTFELCEARVRNPLCAQVPFSLMSTIGRWSAQHGGRARRTSGKPLGQRVGEVRDQRPCDPSHPRRPARSARGADPPGTRRTWSAVNCGCKTTSFISE